MGRKERRLLERARKQEEARNYMQLRAKEQEIVDKTIEKAIDEASEFTKHHITGELYTALAIVLRRPPYRWGRDKTLRCLEKVGGIINDLNENIITDADLVAEGERWGIKVLWNASHEYIEEMDIFEDNSETG